MFLTKLNFALFPLTVIVVPVLFVTGVSNATRCPCAARARSLPTPLSPALLFTQSNDLNLLQLRYNMRAMPIALLAAGWLYYVWRPPLARVVIWTALLAVLVGSTAMTWRTMERYTYQYEENVFLRALETGEDQEGNIGIGGYPIGIDAEQDMADYIAERVPDDQVILTDDAQSLGRDAAQRRTAEVLRPDRPRRYGLDGGTRCALRRGRLLPRLHQ